MNTTTKKLISSNAVQSLLASDLSYRFLFKKLTVIFLYHEVSDTPSQFYAEHDLNVTPARFEQQIKDIKNNFTLITPHQLINKDYTAPAALVTFDDGTAGYFENAVPILKRHDCPSLVFLNMAPIEGDIFYSGLITYLCDYHSGFQSFLEKNYRPELRKPYFLYLRPQWIEEFLADNNRNAIYEKARHYYGPFATPQHLADCKDNPLVYFGNHLYRHYNCAHCSEEELRRQYEKNRLALSQYPHSIDFFSYPFGQENTCYNDTTHRIIFQMGAHAIFAADLKTFNTSGNFFHRLAMNNNIENEVQLKTYLCLKRYQQMFQLGK